MKNQKWRAVTRLGLALPVLAMSIILPAQNPKPANWMTQGTPGEIPVLFAPGVCSTGLYERDVAITPDGRDFYFGIMGAGSAAIAVTHWRDGRWTEPEIAPFSRDERFLNLEPCISPEGQRFFFLSTRPKEGQPPKAGWAYQDIWTMERTATGWSEPKNLGAPVNSDGEEFYPSVTREGTLYFTRSEGAGKESAIFRSRLRDGVYTEPVRLPATINCTANVFNACIAPDESYLILCVAGKQENLGRADYYVCFRNDDDSWSAAINLGPTVNGPGDAAISPSITPDGKFFFFGSSRKIQPSENSPRTYRSLMEERTRPGNGNCDIYWVSTSLIEKLRPKPTS